MKEEETKKNIERIKKEMIIYRLLIDKARLLAGQSQHNHREA